MPNYNDMFLNVHYKESSPCRHTDHSPKRPSCIRPSDWSDPCGFVYVNSLLSGQIRQDVACGLAWKHVNIYHGTPVTMIRRPSSPFCNVDAHPGGHELP